MGAYISQPPAAVNYARIKTGTYVGDGNDNRNIDIGVNLAGKSNVYLIIKSEGSNSALHRIEYGQGDAVMLYTPDTDNPDRIQAFTATGFQVGAQDSVNANGITFRYIAIWQE